MCNRNCDRLCPNLVFSTSVTVETISGTDTLVINIPDATYHNMQRICLVITETIPTTATVQMPVAISIGDGTTYYPMTDCNGLPIVASNIVTRYKYKLKVVTNNTSGVFQVYNLPYCNHSIVLNTIGT